MAYEVVDTEDVSVTDLSEIDGVPVDLNIRAVGDALGVENVNLHLWHFEPGEGINFHAHAEQEEVYYVVEGAFELTLGPPDDTETVEVGPGAFWVAGPETGHGHRYLGDGRGVVLAFGAPPVEDVGKHPSEFE